jgi:ATP-binding cassette subfamily F protein uup
MQSLIQAERISKRFGDKLLFCDISLNLNTGEKAAIVALNGTGKTTLLKILAGDESVDEGKITNMRGLRMAYLPQDPDFNFNASVIDSVFYADSERIRYIRSYHHAIESGDVEQMQVAGEAMDRLQLWDYEYVVKQVLTQLDITEFNVSIRTLSGGQRKRVALAAVLIDEADLIILDEPTNHLDLDMIEWLEDYLVQTKSAVLMVTHDRYFLERVCNRIFEIDEQTLYSYEGNYAYYLEKRELRKDQQMQGAEKAKNLMRTELEWIRRMPKARTHKPRYRIDAFQELKQAAQNSPFDSEMRIMVQAERLGKKVLEIDNLSMSFGNKTLINEFSYKLIPGEKIGIIGSNGTGKSTFLNIIAGLVAPTGGSFVWGKTANFAYYSQNGLQYNDNDKPIDIISAISENISLARGKVVSASGFLQHFMFPPSLQYARIKKLSGGEKRRLYLCSVLVQRPNVLILDEPTNDLDILTLQVLEQYLIDFQGVVIIVSHDRYFMDKVVDHVFVFEGDGVISDFPGNYTVYRTVIEDKQDKIEASPKVEISLKSEIRKSRNKASTKLSFKEKTEMEQIEKNIALLNKQKEEIESSLIDGELNQVDLNLQSKKFAEIIAAIDDAEFRWLEISDKISS